MSSEKQVEGVRVRAGDVIRAHIRFSRGYAVKTCRVEEVGEFPSGEQWASGRYETTAGRWSVNPRMFAKPWRVLRAREEGSE